MNIDINQVSTLTLGVLCVALVLAVLGGLAASVLRSIGSRLQALRTGAAVSLAVGLALTGVLLFRPHEDVFTGLDASAYRLMAQSFLEGRPLHGTDTTLMEVPAGLRRDFLLPASEAERKTRDRSFEITSLRNGQTRPFFYPLLPLCMVGFDAVVPGSAADYFVPFVGFVFFGVCLCVGVAFGGVLGVLCVLALFLGSVLPLWLLRGCYVESVGAILVALPLLEWAASARRRTSWVACLSLGLAVGFHPVLLILALPALLAFRISSDDGGWRTALCLGSFVAGLLPLVLTTSYICAPYGPLDPATIARNVWVSPSHRIAMLFVVVFVALLGAAAVWRGRRPGGDGRRRPLMLILGILACALPTLVSVLFWPERQMVREGLLELGGDIRLWLGVLLAVATLVVLFVRDAARARAIVAIALFTLPVFAYLKGAEPMGLWSQRRLIPTYLLVVAGVLPVFASWLGGLPLVGRFRRAAAVSAAVLLMLAAALANVVRWPAPFFVRFERGADRWVQDVRARMGGRLTVFDRYALSVPPAAIGNGRILGRTEFGFGELPDVVAWLGRKAAREEVLLATAWHNPGLEDGLMLKEEGSVHGSWMRARSKRGLPAIAESCGADVTFLRAVPLEGPVRHLVQDKVMDGGPLGLRGPWGRGDVSIQTPGGRLPALWSRQGSGLVGPVPPPDGSIRFTMKAVFGRAHDPRATQTLHVTPPWGSEPFDVVISNELTEATAVVRRGRGDRSFDSPTGVYRLTAERPYDPAEDGIRGFKPDLGALIHSIRIETIENPGAPAEADR